MRVREEAQITFYRIKRCGFYSHGVDTPEFGTLNDILTQLRDWSNGVDVSLTKMADPSERNENLPVYLFGIINSHNEWVFATWNEVPSHESGVASVKLDSKVGAPEVHINEIEPNTIPGYATYFWAIPNANIIASIRFIHPTGGQEAMRNYINRFMASYSSYAISGRNSEGQPSIIGYTDLPDNAPKNVHPKFQTSAFIKDGPRQRIIDSHAQIRKVARRGHVSTLNAVDRTWWQSSIRFLRGSHAASTNAFVKQSAYIELEYQPTRDELIQMIAAEENDSNASGWDDMGFLLRGESKIRWLSREFATGKFELTFNRLDAEAIDLQSLIETLNANRANILAVLN